MSYVNAVFPARICQFHRNHPTVMGGQLESYLLSFPKLGRGMKLDAQYFSAQARLTIQGIAQKDDAFHLCLKEILRIKLHPSAKLREGQKVRLQLPSHNCRVIPVELANARRE